MIALASELGTLTFALQPLHPPPRESQALENTHDPTQRTRGREKSYRSLAGVVGGGQVRCIRTLLLVRQSRTGEARGSNNNSSMVEIVDGVSLEEVGSWDGGII